MTDRFSTRTRRAGLAVLTLAGVALAALVGVSFVGNVTDAGAPVAASSSQTVRADSLPTTGDDDVLDDLLDQLETTFDDLDDLPFPDLGDLDLDELPFPDLGDLDLDELDLDELPLPDLGELDTGDLDLDDVLGNGTLDELLTMLEELSTELSGSFDELFGELLDDLDIDPGSD